MTEEYVLQVYKAHSYYSSKVICDQNLSWKMSYVDTFLKFANVDQS